MLELIPALPDNVIGIIAKGEVMSDDYKDALEPAIEAALKNHDKIRLLYVLGKDFAGYSGGAMWEDGKLGMSHLTKWEKCAVVTDHEWVRHTVDVFGYLIPGKVRTFSVDEEADASEWVTSD